MDKHIKKCPRCKKDFETEAKGLGYCNECIATMCQQDKDSPDGGAYREHQFT